jgi:NitT/TauT family transport system substrate-binding protein
MKEMSRFRRSSAMIVTSVGDHKGRTRGIAKFNRSARFLTGAALAAGLVTVGASMPAASAAGTHNVRIVLGGGTDFTDASLYYAINQLKAEGITVALSNLADPASALEAVVSGKSDIYLGDPMEAAVAVTNGGANLKYVATVEQTTDYVILSLPKYTLKNLAGATLASAGPGTAGTIIADTALAKIGVKASSLHDVTVGGTSARVTAILSGEVDLAPVLAPSAVSAVATGKVKILLNAGQTLGSYLQEGLISSSSYVQNYPTILQQVVNAFLSASRWASTSEGQFISVANQNQLQGSLTKAQEQASWLQLKNGGFYATNGAICPNAILQTERYTYSAGGTLTKSNTPSYSSWVDPTFVKKYLTQQHQISSSC